jgi:hypothetical protein
MVETIIKSVISVLVSGALGFCISKIKGYKKAIKKKDEENNLTKEALMTMLQSSLTNTYYVYKEIGKIPDYVYRNWLNQLAIYEKLGGDDYIHTIAEKMKELEIVKTDILR